MKKKSAPKKVTKASKGLPPAPPTMQEEANTLTHEFLNYVGTMYKKELPWGTDHTLAPAYLGEMLKPDERVNTIGLSTGEWVRKQFDNFHASITMFRNRHEMNPELRNALGELLQTVSSYAFHDSPVYQKDGSLNEEASEVRFGFEGGQVIKDWKDIGIDVAAWTNERDTILLKERLRLTETIRELIDHLPPVDSKPDGFERIDHVKGPHCKLPDLSNAMHWMKAPTTEGKWLELQREGVACLYAVLDGFVHEQYEHGEGVLRRYSPSQRPTDRWQNMLSERTMLLNAFAKSRGSRERGSTLPYGESFNLAKHHLRHGIKVPHVLTKDEASGLQQRPGTVDARFDHGHPDTATATAEQVGRCWADIFAKEAHELYRTGTKRLSTLYSLSLHLQTFKIGTKEGADVLARMKGESKGAEALAGFSRFRAYLRQTLHEQMAIASDHSGTPTPFDPKQVLRKLIDESKQLATRSTEVDALLDHHLSEANPIAFVEFIRGEVLRWKDDRTRPIDPAPHFGPVKLEQFLGRRNLVDLWLIDRCEQWLERVEPMVNKVEGEKVPPEWSTFDTYQDRLVERLKSLDVKPATTDKVVKATKIKTLADRLDAVPGAREAFDNILRVDGFVTDGQYTGPKRKNKAGILAAWDAVAEKFGLDGYGIDQAAIAAGLCDYIPGLTLGKRIRDNMGNELPYRTALASCERYLKGLE